MHLVNMEVERTADSARLDQRPQGTLRLGPLAPGLNAICGPKGSGKSTLLAWLRRLIGLSAGNVLGSSVGTHVGNSNLTEPRLGLPGSLEVMDRGRRIQIRADRHGNVTSGGGQQSAEQAYPFSVYAGNVAQSDGYLSLTAFQGEVFVGLAAASSAVNTESALEELARRMGALAVDPASGLPIHERESLLTRQRSIEARLERLNLANHTRAELQARRDDLQAELARAEDGHRLQTDFPNRYPAEHQRYEERFELIEADLRDTAERIAELDRQLAERRGELKLQEVSRGSVTIDQSYRAQLQQLDDRLNRWRHTLRDLKSHRQSIENEATDARLDKQVGDQLSPTKEPDPRAALRSLESRILSARGQLDQLVDRYGVLHDVDCDRDNYRDARWGSRQLHSRELDSHGYTVQRDAYGRTRVAYGPPQRQEAGNLPATLRAMQKDLHEACQQLSRHESQAAAETLKQQTAQLQKCETELLQAVEKLIDERAVLLRKIADAYELTNEQLTLAFGDWCECSDHEHLQDWLLEEHAAKSERVGCDPLERQRLLETIQDLESQRRAAQGHLEGCRRQLRDAELYRRGHAARAAGSRPSDWRAEYRGRLPEDIRRELGWTLAELADWERRDEWLRELDEIRHRLDLAGSLSTSDHTFRRSVDRHIAALMSYAAMRGLDSRPRLQTYASSRRPQEDRSERRYDPVDGVVYEVPGDSAAGLGYVHQPSTRYEADVPSAIVRMALRLAIVEFAMGRSEPVALLLDETLDGLALELQQSAVAHLARVAQTGQQIVVLTADERVADLVRGQQGWVGYMRFGSSSRPQDINRHLTAVANDYEQAKWYQPDVALEPRRAAEPNREFYLTERSLVEESPSIQGVSAARCRALGVDRIGDLLDVDPHWLAEKLRLDGIRPATVSSWQAEARLLCSVRQLRPFDARLLVGVGIRTPRQLAEMHPSELLERVEHFLATDRGRRILRSGSTYELSRITTWIASAKGGAGRHHASNFPDDYTGRRSRRAGSIEPAYREREYAARDSSWADGDQDEEASHADWNAGSYERESGPYDDHTRDSSSRRYAARSSESAGSGQADRSSHRSVGNSRNAARRHTVDSSTNRTSHRSTSRQPREQLRSGARDGRVHLPHEEKSARLRNSDEARRQRDSLRLARTESLEGSRAIHDVGHMKFYLELASPVVDAPSIGPRMAARLEKLGILTVDQLLAANPETLADKLNNRRVDEDTIRAWQEQARLVCRIPNLRGHDAQLLVTCNLVAPEEIAAMNPSRLLEQVMVVVESSEGQRIVRGGKQPDLSEVSDWIAWAASCRSLNAA